MSPSPSREIRSRLYACRVLHERQWPKRHRFAYRVFYLALDLDELDQLGAALPGFGVDRARLLSLWRRDYFSDEPAQDRKGRGSEAIGRDAGAELKRRVERFCAAHGAALGGGGRVTLVTLPRMFGYAFNPVSFYFCFAADGTPRGAIAEVTNTYGETKPFFVDVASAAAAPVFHARVPKHFYVSPFSSVAAEFEFRLFAPGRRLAIQVDHHEAGRRTLHSTLTGRAEPLTGARLLGCLVRYPLLTARVITLIHWQALRLWLKRVPHHPKAANPDLQRDVRRPHRSQSAQLSA